MKFAVYCLLNEYKQIDGFCGFGVKPCRLNDRDISLSRLTCLVGRYHTLFMEGGLGNKTAGLQTVCGVVAATIIVRYRLTI